jgi:hypothetical protein
MLAAFLFAVGGGVTGLPSVLAASKICPNYFRLTPEFVSSVASN